MALEWTFLSAEYQKGKGFFEEVFSFALQL